jgi:DNA-directed RNA polymerase specialized sigma24 family protein
MDLEGYPAADAAVDPAADPAVGLRAVLALRRLAERVEAEQVALARDQGWSWQQIADVLGMTRQSVHAKHGGAP